MWLQSQILNSTIVASKPTNTSINGHGCALRKFYLQKHVEGLVFGPLIWHANQYTYHSLLAPD